MERVSSAPEMDDVISTDQSSRSTKRRAKVWNRAKLKISKTITNTSRVSVRNIIKSAREGAKQIASE
jgi:hypothetical protein